VRKPADGSSGGARSLLISPQVPRRRPADPSPPPEGSVATPTLRAGRLEEMGLMEDGSSRKCLASNLQPGPLEPPPDAAPAMHQPFPGAASELDGHSLGSDGRGDVGGCSETSIAGAMVRPRRWTWPFAVSIAEPIAEPFAVSCRAAGPRLLDGGLHVGSGMAVGAAWLLERRGC